MTDGEREKHFDFHGLLAAFYTQILSTATIKLEPFLAHFTISQLLVYATTFVCSNSLKTPSIVDRMADPNPTIPEDQVRHLPQDGMM